MKLAYPLMAATAFFALAALPGCGRSAAGLCEDKCDCTQECSPNDLDRCADRAEDLEKVVEEERCTDEYDATIACLSAEFDCRGDDPDFSGCESELDDLGDCTDGRATPYITILF